MVLIANLFFRQMAHDPEDYPDPASFKPERFLVEGGKPMPPDPRTLIFGFGRRYVQISLSVFVSHSSHSLILYSFKFLP